MNKIYIFFVLVFVVLCGLVLYKYFNPETSFSYETKKVYGSIIDSETVSGPYGKNYQNLISYYFVTVENDTVFSQKQNRDLVFKYATGCKIGVEYQTNKPKKNYPFFLKDPECLEVKVFENSTYKLIYTQKTFVLAKKLGKHMLKDKVFGVIQDMSVDKLSLKDLKTKEIEEFDLNNQKQLNYLFNKN